MHLTHTLWTVAAVGAFALAPASASAQCSMMGGDTSAEHQHDTGKMTKNEKKVHAAARDLLASDMGRCALSEEALANAGFMKMFLTRLAESPEWRAVASEKLALGSPAAHEVERAAVPAAGVTTGSGPASSVATDAGAASSAVETSAPAVSTTPRQAPPANAAAYVCPMHPEVTSSKSGTCPKCGMTLEKAGS